MTNDLHSIIHSEINRIRNKQGLLIIGYSEHLEKLAQDKSKQMADTNIISHDYPISFQERMKNGGYNHSSGENLQVNNRQCGILDIVENGWMKSEGHRENILNNNWYEEGIGIFYSGNRIFLTQIFGCDQSCIYNEKKDQVSGIEKYKLTQKSDELICINETDLEIH